MLARIEVAYQAPTNVYGGRAQQIARAARDCPEAFLLVFRYAQAGVEQPEWRQAIFDLVGDYTLDRWFRPGPDAPPGAEQRARYASRLNVGPFIENLIRWIEGEDGLDEATRLYWWGRIQKEFHLSSREAFRLGSLPTPAYVLPREP